MVFELKHFQLQRKWFYIDLVIYFSTETYLFVHFLFLVFLFFVNTIFAGRFCIEICVRPFRECDFLVKVKRFVALH